MADSEKDKPCTQKSAHEIEGTHQRDARELDLRDIAHGAYHPVNQWGKPQPDQVPLATTPHEAAQWGADVRPGPNLSHPEPDLPEGLRRPRVGPDGLKRDNKG